MACAKYVESKNSDFFSFKKVGVVKKKFVVEWDIPKNHQKVARSNVFQTGQTSNCLVVSTVSEEPECLSKFDVWIYTKTKAIKDKTTVSFALLDDKNCLHCSQEKVIRSSSAESDKVGVTFDFGVFKKPQIFFRDGVLRIYCVIEMSEEVPDGSIDHEDTKTSLLKRVSNINVEGNLKFKTVIIWNMPKSCASQGEVRSDFFTFCSSEFLLHTNKCDGLTDPFIVTLYRKSKNSTEDIGIKIAIVDARDKLHDAHEEVMRHLNKARACFDKSKFQKRQWLFYPNDMLSIHCEMKVDFSKSTGFKQDPGIPDASRKEVKSLNITPCCDLDNPAEKLSHLMSFYPTGEYSDIILRTEGKELKAHRLILAALAPKFLAELNLSTIDKNEIHVNVQNMHIETLSQILDYIYTGQTNASSPESFMSLLSAAHKFDLSTLKVKARNFLASALTSHNALQILIVANQCNEDDLKKSTLKVICNNIREVLKTSEWETFPKMHLELVNDIILALSERNENGTIDKNTRLSKTNFSFL